MRTCRLMQGLIGWLLLAPIGMGAAQKPGVLPLEQVLNQMEAVGKTFRSFKAHFSQKKYTAVLKEFDAPESGEFYYGRAQDGSALFRQEFTKPAAKILTIKGGIAQLYQPALRQAQVVSLGKNKDKAEYLAVGLGQSPAKLSQTFDMKVEGAEAVNGIACSVLALRPKDPAAAAHFSSITLWVTNPGGIPIQHKLQEPNGDFLLVNFLGEKLNVHIPASLFDQKLPPGVEIQRYQ
jgi:outer membrane lipoprotein-sorting protein